MQNNSVKVESWNEDPDFPVFPVGSKPKKMLRCPAQPPISDLIGSHSYLFKIGAGWRWHQVWSEFIAYHLAQLVGLEVPPCFIAEDQETGEFGALIEFFFGYPGQQSERLVHGVDYLNVREDSDRPHSARTNIRLSSKMGIVRAANWWAKLLTFDALIGNTDRHPENWGFLVETNLEGAPSIRMAPTYDNGTSLGYELTDARIAGMSDEALASYISQGKHHCGWADSDEGSALHYELCKLVAINYPDAIPGMRAILEISDDALSNILRLARQIATSRPLTQQRVEFVDRLIRSRRDLLLQILGG